MRDSFCTSASFGDGGAGGKYSAIVVVPFVVAPLAALARAGMSKRVLQQFQRREQVRGGGYEGGILVHGVRYGDLGDQLAMPWILIIFMPDKPASVVSVHT